MLAKGGSVLDRSNRIKIGITTSPSASAFRRGNGQREMYNICVRSEGLIAMARGQRGLFFRSYFLVFLERVFING